MAVWRYGRAEGSAAPAGCVAAGRPAVLPDTHSAAAWGERHAANALQLRASFD